MLLESPEFIVERAALDDVVEHEGARYIVHDNRAAVIADGDWKTCVFADVNDFNCYADKYDLYGKVCLMGAPLTAPSALGFSAVPCKSYAYVGAMPPALDLPKGVEIKRLAPSLAQTVFDAYTNRGGGYTLENIAGLMKTRGVFGAISGGKLAGFIGMHDDGSMGMLEVFDGFRRRGIGSALERFLINYVMTFGRVPLCAVYIDNPVSMEMQKKLGLTQSNGFSFWAEIKKQ